MVCLAVAAVAACNGDKKEETAKVAVSIKADPAFEANVANVTVTLDQVTDKDVVVTLAAESPINDAITLPEITIKAEAKSAKGQVEIDPTVAAPGTYNVVVKIESATNAKVGTPSSATIEAVVVEPKTDSATPNVSFNITPELSENALIPNPITGLERGFTIEVRYYSTQWNRTGQCNRLIALEGKGEHPAVMLRWSNTGSTRQGQLHLSCDDFFGGASGSPQVTNTSNQKYTWATNTWTTISIVYDGSKMYVYDNGTLVNSYNTSLSYDAFTIERVEFGMSWEEGAYDNSTYPTSQLFYGNIDYVRVWNVVRSAEEIASSLCTVSPQTEGLKAYWRFNDTDEYKLIDKAGDNDIDWNAMSEMDGGTVRKTLQLGESFKAALKDTYPLCAN